MDVQMDVFLDGRPLIGTLPPLPLQFNSRIQFHILLFGFYRRKKLPNAVKCADMWTDLLNCNP